MENKEQLKNIKIPPNSFIRLMSGGNKVRDVYASDKNMDIEKAERLYNGNPLKLRFCNYYKYAFYFKGETNDIIVEVEYSNADSGDPYDIYKYEVDTKKFDAPETLWKLIFDYTTVEITEKATGDKFRVSKCWGKVAFDFRLEDKYPLDKCF